MKVTIKELQIVTDNLSKQRHTVEHNFWFSLHDYHFYNSLIRDILVKKLNYPSYIDTCNSQLKLNYCILYEVKTLQEVLTVTNILDSMLIESIYIKGKNKFYVGILYKPVNIENIKHSNTKLIPILIH